MSLRKSQQQLVNSGKRDLFLQIFCCLKLKLENLERSNLLMYTNIPFKARKRSLKKKRHVKYFSLKCSRRMFV